MSQEIFKVTNYNVNILRDLLNQLPAFAEQVKAKYPNYKQWLSGEDYPTYDELVDISNIFHIPFGYFFFDRLPKRTITIPDFRNNKTQPSLELLDTLSFAEHIQDWAKDILAKWGNDKLELCGKYKNNLDIGELVFELKNIFEINNNWADIFIEWDNALDYLVDKADNKGIIILRNSTVHNELDRPLNINEFRGFVLYDDLAPVIFINNQGTTSDQILTLVNGVTHILIGESAFIGLDNLLPDNNDIERFCDMCTSEFFVPASQLKEAYEIETNINILAQQFNVSPILIAKRLLDMGLTTKELFLNIVQQLYQEEKSSMQLHKKETTNIKNIYETQFSRRFLQILTVVTSQGDVLYGDALKIIKANATTLDNLIKEYDISL